MLFFIAFNTEQIVRFQDMKLLILSAANDLNQATLILLDEPPAIRILMHNLSKYSLTKGAEKLNPALDDKLDLTVITSCF